MTLDATSLGTAVRRLREGLAHYQRDPTDKQIRDGLIQHAMAFSDSDLRYKVDLIDWHNIDDHCGQPITVERVALTQAANPDGRFPSREQSS